MQKYYKLMSGDKYAKYYTKESLDYDDALGYQSFGEIYDKAKIYLAEDINPIGAKWNESLNNTDNEKRFIAYLSGKLAIYDKNESWNPPILREDKLGKRKAKRKGDIHSVYSNESSILFSQNSIDKIGNILEKYGVLLPFKVEDREDTLYRYWVTTTKPFKCVDELSSYFHVTITKEKNIRKERVDSISLLTLKEECQDNPIIFRIEDVLDNGIFVTNTFIELIKKYKLKGFSFCENASPSSNRKCIDI